MTNEKALEILKSIDILSFRDKKRKYFMRDVWKAQKVAIKALEQQPCEDWLSTFNTESATECFTAVQRLKESVNADSD